MKKPTICDILAKQLACTFREKYPDLRIEGHPAQNDADYAYIPLPRLIIGNRSRDFLLQFFFIHRTDDVMIVRVSISSKIPYSCKMRKSQTFELSNPNSIDDLERWIRLFIGLYHNHPGKNSSDTINSEK